MGVAGEDHVDALHAPGHLAVHVEAVVREEDHQLRALGAGLVHDLLHPLLADAEGEVGEHPARVGDGRVGEGLADHRDLRAAALEIRDRVEGRLVPGGVEDVGAEEGEGQRVDDLAHPVDAERELPVRGHGVGLQRVHHVDHVLAVRPQRRQRALPGVAAVEEERLRPLGADALQDGRDPVEPAHAAVLAGERDEVLRGQGVGHRRARLDAVELQEVLARDVRRLARLLADPDVDRGLAEVDRLELGVDVGDVHQRHVARGGEACQRLLGEALRRGQPRQSAAEDGRGGHGGLEEFTPRNHARS